jgi:hypothetical protein
VLIVLHSVDSLPSSELRGIIALLRLGLQEDTDCGSAAWEERDGNAWNVPSHPWTAKPFITARRLTRGVLAAVSVLVWGMATVASATPIPRVQVRDVFGGVLTGIVDQGNLLGGQLQVDGPFHGAFSYTSTSLAPDWTTFNQSDPGLTLVELFAFLGENLLYRANQIPERNRPASLTFVLTEDLHIVEPCGGYLSSTLVLPFELCLRLEFFNALAPEASTPTSVFDLAQWDTARFFLYPMGAVTDHGVRFNESTASSFLVTGSIIHPTTTVTPIPEPSAILLIASGVIAVAIHCSLQQCRPVVAVVNDEGRRRESVPLAETS